MTIKEEYRYKERDSKGVIVEGYRELKPDVYYEVLIQRVTKNLRGYAVTMEEELYNKSEDESMYYYDKNGNGEKIRLTYIDKLDDIANYKARYPNLLRHSLITNIYSFTEERLLDMCRRSAILLQLSTLNEYINADKRRRKHKGIFLAKEYLKDCANIDISSFSHTWNRLNAFNKLRNCIVHELGSANSFYYMNNKRKRENLQKAIDYLGDEIVDLEYGHLVLTDKASFRFLDTIDELFKEFYEILVKQIKIKENNQSS
ncbi:hypothetical protein [Priestia endophytica]|uniref:hypothetical protein n=1 Tax=Priestia endophytica TaxID=135735 RepID=UPI000F53FE74|nr:hypothetical protein [Priestia endophytica]RPK08301.1 hypothetical protein FH5_04931 [Priestia endophytica]